MNIAEIKKLINTWMIQFLEIPNFKFNNFPICPFARQARIQNKIEIIFTEPNNFDSAINDSLPILNEKDVVILCFDHNLIDPIDLERYVIKLNQSLMKQDFVILEDHPAQPEYINELKMNFGECGLLLIQKLNKLNEASALLKNKGYYNYWSKENLDLVVNWRTVTK